MHCARRVLLGLVLATSLLASVVPPVAPPVQAQATRIDPRDVALRPSDLPPGFTVVNEESRPLDPGSGVVYAVTMERPITAEAAATGPVSVIQVIGRFDQTISYEGFLDALRRQAIDEDGFELVPGAPNDGGTASLQKLDGEVAAFRVGFIKRDMVVFTGWLGRRGVITLQGLLTLAGVTSHRYDEALQARTGVTVASEAQAPPAPAAPPGQRGQIANTGGTGANVRALPQVNSELLQVVHDGEPVELIGVEEKGADGRAWRNVRTSAGTVGWVVVEYVTTDAGGVAVAPSPPPPPPTPTPAPRPAPRAAPTPTPRASGSVDTRLAPALRTLFGIRRGPSGGKPWGDWYRGVVEASGVSMFVEPLPVGVGGFYRARTNSITISSLVLNEDVRTIATILAHELTHVAQSMRGMGASEACVEREVEAMQNQLVVWVILYEGLAPGRTQQERYRNALVRVWMNEGDPVLYKLVVDTPGYQDQCNLWVP